MTDKASEVWNSMEHISFVPCHLQEGGSRNSVSDHEIRYDSQAWQTKQAVRQTKQAVRQPNFGGWDGNT